MTSLRSGCHYGWRFSNLILAGGARPLAGTPLWSPKGGRGGPCGPVSTGGATVSDVKTQALRVTVGAYTPDHWHVTLVMDTYERGVLKNSDLLEALWGTDQTVSEHMMQALGYLIQMEHERLEKTAEPADSGQ